MELEGKEFIPFMVKLVEWYVEAKGEANAAVGSEYKMATGQSGLSYDNSQLPGPIKNIRNSFEAVQDRVNVSKPAIRVLDVTSKLASLTPAGEAGAAVEIVETAAGGALTKNLFTGGMSSVAKGELGEQLTKTVLEQRFPGADVLEQVDIKMDGAKTTADFVIVKEGKVIGVFEAKVNESALSNAQKLFFNDGEPGVFAGKNAPPHLRGTEIDPAKVTKATYRWNSETGRYTIE